MRIPPSPAGLWAENWSGNRTTGDGKTGEVLYVDDPLFLDPSAYQEGIIAFRELDAALLLAVRAGQPSPYDHPRNRNAPGPDVSAGGQPTAETGGSLPRRKRKRRIPGRPGVLRRFGGRVGGRFGRPDRRPNRARGLPGNQTPVFPGTQPGRLDPGFRRLATPGKIRPD